MDIIEKAKLFATAAHGAVGQVRKYTNEPYIVHPQEVVEIVMTVPHTLTMLAVAYLHDVVEDTHIKLEDIEREFGQYVADQVRWLTDVSKPGDGNRAMRKAIDREFIAGAPPEAQTIKLADLISNTMSIVKHDPRFAAVYLEEKKLLLEVLQRGDPVLFRRATELVEDGLLTLRKH